MAGITSQFAPSRELYKDYSTEADIFNSTLGDTPLSPLANVAKGINAGVDLGNKVNTFIRDNSPQAAEMRRLDLEIKRSQASTQSQAASMGAIKARHAAVLDEASLLKETVDLEKDTMKAQDSVSEMKLMREAYQGMSQIQDAASFNAFLSEPKFLALQKNEDFGNIMRNRASRLLIGAAPEEQVKLVQLAESISPGSGAKLEPLLSTQAQALTADPYKAAKANGTAQPKKTAAQLAREEDLRLSTASSFNSLNKNIRKGFQLSDIKYNPGGPDATKGVPLGSYVEAIHPESKEVQRIPLGDYVTAKDKTRDSKITALEYIIKKTMANNPAQKQQEGGSAKLVTGEQSGTVNLRNSTDQSKSAPRLDTQEAKIVKQTLGLPNVTPEMAPYLSKIAEIGATAKGWSKSTDDAVTDQVKKLARAAGVDPNGEWARQKTKEAIEVTKSLFRSKQKRLLMAEKRNNAVPQSGLPTPTISSRPSQRTVISATGGAEVPTGMPNSLGSFGDAK
jgi:hypothetical protein